MKLLKGFQSVVLLLVTLSFLLLLYKYTLKFWREGFGNIGEAPPPEIQKNSENGIPCGDLTCRAGIQQCAGGPGNYHCVGLNKGGAHNDNHGQEDRGSRDHGGGDYRDGDHGGGDYRDGDHGGGYGVKRQDRINCQKPEHGIAKSGHPHGWNKECIVPPGVTPDEGGFSAYKLCGGSIDAHQKEKGHFPTDCRKRWKVTSKGEVTLASPSTHGYKHGAHKHMSYEKPHSLRKDKSHRYKQWIPDHLDKTHITQSDYEKIGKKFIADEAHSRNIHAPPVLDSEAEVLGRLVWRVYTAEIEQKRANSPKSHEELVDQETNLLNKVSQIMRSQTDYTSSNKCASIIKCAKEVNSQYLSNNYTHGRTTNMYGDHHEEPVQRKVGYAFEGRQLHGSPAYSDANSAISHCKEDRGCGGINYNTHTHRYELMPKDAHLAKRRGMVAYVKNQGHSAWKKHCHSEQGHHNDRDHNDWGHDKHRHNDDWRHHRKSYKGNEYDYQGREDTPRHYGSSLSHYNGGQSPWQPQNPNIMPKPYNSLMDLFS